MRRAKLHQEKNHRHRLESRVPILHVFPLLLVANEPLWVR